MRNILGFPVGRSPYTTNLPVTTVPPLTFNWNGAPAPMANGAGAQTCTAASNSIWLQKKSKTSSNLPFPSLKIIPVSFSTTPKSTHTEVILRPDPTVARSFAVQWPYLQERNIRHFTFGKTALYGRSALGEKKSPASSCRIIWQARGSRSNRIKDSHEPADHPWRNPP